ncbi:MAG: hypothetical protein AAB368_03670, partial [bacterium]
PARLKFLKSPAAETAAIARALEPYVLTQPSVRFSLTVDGEERLNAPPATEPGERVRAVMGEGGDALLPAHAEAGECVVRGFVEAPGAVRRRGRMWLVVNRRPVEDRALRHAVVASYGGALPRDAFPAAALFIDLPPHLVDVNVHPAKTEVRFADPQAVYQAVRAAVRGAFASREGVAAPPGFPAAPAPPEDSPVGHTSGSAAPPSVVSEPEPLWLAARLPRGGEVEILAQLFSTYVVARTADGLLLVDQHTAHEKVIYERLLRRGPDTAAQALLVPLPVELSPEESLLVAGHAKALRAVGLELDGFGGTTVVIRAAPPGAAARALPGLLRGLLEGLPRSGRPPD